MRVQHRGGLLSAWGSGGLLSGQTVLKIQQFISLSNMTFRRLKLLNKSWVWIRCLGEQAKVISVNKPFSKVKKIFKHWNNISTRHWLGARGQLRDKSKFKKSYVSVPLKTLRQTSTLSPVWTARPSPEQRSQDRVPTFLQVANISVSYTGRGVGMRPN